MSKIICEVCGTSYSDSSAQCPICGYVDPTMAEGHFQESGETMDSGEYTYVKGGRFSKNNVKKRIKSNPIEDIDEYGAPEEFEPEERRKETPLVIFAVILLLAIAAVVLFITMHFFGPNGDKAQQEQNDDFTLAAEQTTTQETTDDGIVECVKLEVSDTEITIPEGGTYEISVIKEPVDTTEQLLFESADPEIATVDENGVVTPVKTGTTTIIVTCGEQKIELTVSCEVKVEEPFMLTRMELELTAVGATWELYAGTISVDEITFKSDDEKIVTIDENGVVTAVAEGQTVVHAQYGDETVSCNVTCKFDQETTQGDDSGVGEDGTQGNENNTTEEGTQTGELLTQPPKATGTKGYKIKTNFGDAYVSQKNPALFDVGHYVGYDITLRLVDGNGNPIDATWTVYNTSICKAKTAGGRQFSCLAEGKAFVVATTEDGQTYVCIIRVAPYPGG